MVELQQRPLRRPLPIAHIDVINVEKSLYVLYSEIK